MKQRKYQVKNNKCDNYQQHLAEQSAADLSTWLDEHPDDHTQQCGECRAFIQSLIKISGTLRQVPNHTLVPDPHIPDRILDRIKNAKQRGQNIKVNRWNWVRSIFEYRIPAYQAVGGAIVFTTFIIFLLGYFVPAGPIMNINDGLDPRYEFSAVDSLNQSRSDIGETVREDSLLSRFLVPTM
ncbi:MAG: hypothetical protein E4H13_08970 [Calditrichales bacterium]|nr:MAG: hypothetical protein E4H13_08970 [Calditrichales bacterium]